MSFLKNIFGSDNDSQASRSFWKNITSEEELEAAVAESFNRPVIIFKHSTRCHISKMVLKSFEQEVAQADRDVAYYFLDLISFRGLSNKIAGDFGVTHQSPQMIVLRDGIAVRNASHQSISLSLV